MDRLDLEDIKNKTKEKIAISKFQKKEYMKTKNVVYSKSENRIKMIKRTIATVALCSMFTTGIVFSNDMSKYIYNYYHTSKGVEIAINNGYNAKFNEEYAISNESIIDLNNNNQGISQDAIKITADDIVMDDSTLSIEFSISLSDEINKKINLDEQIQVNLFDLLVSDENNNVLFSSDIEKACEFLNISSEINNSTGDKDYDKLFESGKFFNSGVNNFVLENKNGNIKLIYNIYLEGQEVFYPRSKRLNFDIGKIDISGDKILNYEGKWQFSLELPDNIVNRKRISYKQVSENEENKVLNCDVLSTGTQIKLSLKTDSSIDSTESPQLKLINAMEIEEPSVQIRDWFVDKLMASDEYKKYEEDLRKIYSTEDIYIENENGEKFKMSQGPYANGGGEIVNGFYEPTITLDLTTSNMTDKLKIHLKYSNKEIVFELEKEGEV